MLQFTKMQGLGNDFVVLDGVNQKLSLTSNQMRFLADRRYGIGCDQVLLVEAAEHPGADFRYRIFNADGGEVAQCGNGARCVARFVRENHLTRKSELRVETGAGLLTLQLREDGDVTVDMGVPRHRPDEIPLRAERQLDEYALEVDGRELRFAAVSMGNPHAVIRVADVERAPVREVGSALQSHALFPERVNVGFMQVVAANHIRLRVFERGSGETSACGSGACAAVVVGIEQGLLHSPVCADLPGGSLRIGWQGRGAAVFMTGPAVTVFRGTIEL